MTDGVRLRSFAPGSAVTQLRWLAVWTKPRAEKVAARALESLSVPHWLPVMPSRRRWSDRWKVIEFPLFPGYVFARASTETWITLLGVPGVLTVVKQGRNPAWIREEQIADLQRAVEVVRLNDEEPQIETDFVQGDLVQVVNGPLASIVGTVREVRGGRRLLIGIEQIGRAISISIGAANVKRVLSAAEASEPLEESLPCHA